MILREASGSCKGWDRDYITPKRAGKDFSSGFFSGIISCQLGDYMLPTTFLGNQKQPLKVVQIAFLLGLKIQNGLLVESRVI